MVCVSDFVVKIEIKFRNFYAKGLVNLFNINRDLAANNLVRRHAFEGLHKFQGNSPAPCTGISVCGNSVATVGEDGRFVHFELFPSTRLT